MITAAGIVHEAGPLLSNSMNANCGKMEGK